jgi:hypothetical protein
MGRRSTLDDVREDYTALRNLDTFIANEIARESRSEAERIMIQGVFESHPETREKMHAHYGGMLKQSLRHNATDIIAQVNENIASAQSRLERESSKWESSRSAEAYNMNASRAAARAGAAVTAREARRLIDTATTREEIETAIEHAAPLLQDRVRRGAIRGDSSAGAEIHSATMDATRRLEALRPESYRAAAAGVESSWQFAHQAAVELQRANDETGGSLNEVLGLSPFSTGPGIQLPAAPAPAELFQLT